MLKEQVISTLLSYSISIAKKGERKDRLKPHN